MRTYEKLRQRMGAYGYNGALLSEALGKDNTQYISQCMRGVTAWRLDEIYKITRLLEISVDEIYLYFPEGGKPAKEIKKDDSAKRILQTLVKALEEAI